MARLFRRTELLDPFHRHRGDLGIDVDLGNPGPDRPQDVLFRHTGAAVQDKGDGDRVCDLLQAIVVYLGPPLVLAVNGADGDGKGIDPRFRAPSCTASSTRVRYSSGMPRCE